jgi:flagellum-specific peptidoglycan hydrolase FlgJ
LRPTPKPRWQQATAVVSLGAGGVVTGLSFVPGSPADLTSPATLPFALMALEKSAQPAPSEDAMLRSAIVHVARHYLRMAERKTPAEMEQIIWQHDSLDGADHGPSCAAFASLTLALGSHVIGHQSWVTGGTSYPWPMHAWADARVDPNPASPQVVSVVQDAQAHHRWHPLGDGYQPQPGDWVLFDGHVEVVTQYAGGVLHTIGGDSLPNFSVNAHEYVGPMGRQGVAGFVDNGLRPAAAQPGAQAAAPSGRQVAARGAGDAHAPRAHPAQRGAKPSAQRAARPAPASATLPAAAAVTTQEVLAPRAIPVPPAAARVAAHQVLAPRATVGPPAPAGVTAQEVLAPRAIPVPPAAASRYPPQSRALAASGANTSPEGGASPHSPGPARTQDTARVVPQPQKADHPRGPETAKTSQAPGLVHGRNSGQAAIPATGMPAAAGPGKARPGQAAIPGLLRRAHHPARSAGELAPYQRHQPAPAAQPAMPGTAAHRAFIERVAPGAMATQQKYGVPASVTIAQAIDESGWGQSILASQDHNLFGIKGSGPAGSDLLPTQEVIGGQLVDSTAPFRVYHNIGQSIVAHGKLLARSDYYTNAMANKHQPNAFAEALTGVYATDPSYGGKLIALMQHYDLYRFDAAPAAQSHPRTPTGAAAIPGLPGHRGAAHENAAVPGMPVQPPRPARHPARPARPVQPGPTSRPTAPAGPAPKPTPAGTPDPAATAKPVPVPSPQRASGTAQPTSPAPAPRPPSMPDGAATPVPASASRRLGPAGTAETALTTAAAGQQAPGAAAAIQSTPAPHQGRAAAASPSGPGTGQRPAPSQSPAGNRDPGHLARSAHAGQRAASADPGWTADAAVPGTGPQAPSAREPGAAAGHAAAPGQADIPGLPYPAAARTVRRARTAPGPRPAHPSSSTRRTGAAQPTWAAGRAGGHQHSSPFAPQPPANAPMSRPAAAADGQAPPGRQAVMVGAATIPGLLDGPAWQVASSPSVPTSTTPFPGATGAPAAASTTGPDMGTSAGPATGAAAGQSDVAIPGLLPDAVAPGERPAHGAEAPPPGGAWIPGLPDPAGHPGHGSAVARPGAAFRGAGHGTDLAPTEAYRLASGGEPPASRGHTAARAAASLPATASSTPATAAAGHGPRSVSRVPASTPAPAARSPQPAAPPAPSQSAPASPASAAATTFGWAVPDAAATGTTAVTAVRYGHRLPPAVGKAFVTSAKVPLIRSESLYVDVAGLAAIPWEILAACDWMQCRAKNSFSPVYGEKLGAVNPDGTSYRTRSAALERCSYDLAELAWSVYWIDLTRSDPLSVRELANVFAAFRWGGLLREHHTSAMEFPYSVAGLTTRHMHMRWPNIDDPEAPDKPGAKFHQAFGAVPIVLSLDYPATA